MLIWSCSHDLGQASSPAILQLLCWGIAGTLRLFAVEYIKVLLALLASNVDVPLHLSPNTISWGPPPLF